MSKIFNVFLRALAIIFRTALSLVWMLLMGATQITVMFATELIQPISDQLEEFIRQLAADAAQEKELAVKQ